MKKITAAALAALIITTPITPTITHAQTTTTQTTSTPVIPASAITYEGIYTPDGKRFTGNRDVTKEPIDMKDGWKLRLKVDLTEFNKNDTISISMAANSKEGSGGGILFGNVDNNVVINDKPALKLKSYGERRDSNGIITNGIKIIGLDAVENMQGQTTLDIAIFAPAGFYSTGQGLTPGEKTQTQTFENQPIKYYITTYTTDGKPLQRGPETKDESATITWKQIVEGDLRHFHRHWMGSAIENTTKTVVLSSQTWFPSDMPGGKGFVIMEPNNTDEKFAKWNVSDESKWKVEVKAISAKNPTEPKFTDAELAEFAKQIKAKATKTEKGWRVDVENVPQNVIAQVLIKNIGYTDIANPIAYSAKRVDSGPITDRIKNGGSSATSVQGLFESSDSSLAIVRKPTGVVKLNDIVTTAETAQEVTANKPTKAILVIKNEGNTKLSNPNITSPNGETITHESVIEPGKSENVEVEFTPTKDKKEYTWKVEYSNADALSLTTHVKFAAPADPTTEEPSPSEITTESETITTEPTTTQKQQTTTEPPVEETTPAEITTEKSSPETTPVEETPPAEETIIEEPIPETTLMEQPATVETPISEPEVEVTEEPAPTSATTIEESKVAETATSDQTLPSETTTSTPKQENRPQLAATGFNTVPLIGIVTLLTLISGVFVLTRRK